MSEEIDLCDTFVCPNIRDAMSGIYECTVKKSINVNGQLLGYSCRIWFPICDRSIYGKYGNLIRYGDERHTREQWDSPRKANNEDRSDPKFLPEKVKLDHDPKHPENYLPDWSGRALVTGLEASSRYIADLTGDPYGGQEIWLVLPNDLEDIPANSKVEIDTSVTPSKEILTFHTLPVKIRRGNLNPQIRRVQLSPSEDE